MWASKAQQAWGNTAGVAKMGADKVHEFNEATKGKYGLLPERVKPAHTPKLKAFKLKGK